MNWTLLIFHTSVLFSRNSCNTHPQRRHWRYCREVKRAYNKIHGGNARKMFVLFYSVRWKIVTYVALIVAV